MLVVVAAVLDLDVAVELVLVAAVEVVVLGLLVDVGWVVVVVVVVEVVADVELREQFPSWQMPYPQNEGPVPHFPAALQQSPHTPAHSFQPCSLPQLPSVV